MCFDGAAEHLRRTDYADACPIETVALEVASTNPQLRAACAEVFEAWIDSATRRGQRAGIPKAKARELAIVFISALEGAFVLSRTLRDPAAVKLAGRTVAAAVAAALPPTAAKRRASKPAAARRSR